MASHTKLAKVIRRLGKLLPKKGPLDSLTEQEEWNVRSYVILCHAAIEGEIERQCIETAKRVLVSANRGQFGPAAMSLLLHRLTQVGAGTVESHAANIRKDRLSLIKMAVNMYIADVRDGNHGIKDKHLRAMLGPLGVDVDSLDLRTVAALNQLGVKRGQVAHDLGAGIGPEYHAATVREWTAPFSSESNNVFAEIGRVLSEIQN